LSSLKGALQWNGNAPGISPCLRLRRRRLRSKKMATKIKMARERRRGEIQEPGAVRICLPPSHEDMINAFEERDKRLARTKEKRNCIVLTR